MGKVNLITLPKRIKSKIKGSILCAAVKVPKNGTEFDADEVTDWSIKYLSGISVDIIASEYDVNRARIYNGMRRHCAWAGAGKQLFRENRKRRLAQQRVLEFEEFYA